MIADMSGSGFSKRTKCKDCGNEICGFLIVQQFDTDGGIVEVAVNHKKYWCGACQLQRLANAAKLPRK